MNKRSYNNWIISFDPAKRDETLRERKLDFADAAEVFDNANYRFEDDRIDYGETRIITVGYLQERMVIVIWVERETVRHIISMRKANAREEKRYANYLD